MNIRRKICFIPLRKGSKGIPGKNIKFLCGKPLFCWVLDTLIQSGISDEIWIATDCIQVEEYINEYYEDKVSLFRRCEQNAADHSPTIDVVLEFLEKMKYSPSDYLVLLQATSPFTTTSDLKKLFSILENGQCTSCISCHRLKKFRWDEEGIPLDYTFSSKPRRQDYKGLLIETGSFYVSTIHAILKQRQLLSGKIEIIEVGAAGMIDIDEDEDWRLAEAYLKNLRNNNENESERLLY